jgi:hypothetical protein
MTWPWAVRHRDFFDLEEVGSGEHGKVYKCVRRMDLWPYAVKVLQRGVAGPRDREQVLQEIYALASQVLFGGDACWLPCPCSIACWLRQRTDAEIVC